MRYLQLGKICGKTPESWIRMQMETWPDKLTRELSWPMGRCKQTDRHQVQNTSRPRILLFSKKRTKSEKLMVWTEAYSNLWGKDGQFNSCGCSALVHFMPVLSTLTGNSSSRFQERVISISLEDSRHFKDELVCSFLLYQKPSFICFISSVRITLPAIIFQLEICMQIMLVLETSLGFVQPHLFWVSY